MAPKRLTISFTLASPAYMEPVFTKNLISFPSNYNILINKISKMLHEILFALLGHTGSIIIELP